jgi:predicted ATPase/DNA-binding SARP family transcriptional activator/DNA-binding CsgD family transcriptional regulator
MMSPPADSGSSGHTHSYRGSEQQIVRIGLLGGFRVLVGDRRVEESGWRRRKAASLVKLLALTPGHHLHREQAMDLLWPDLSKRAASNNLRQVLHAARRAFDPHPATASRYVVVRGEQLILSPQEQVWVDTEAFEHAARTARQSREPAAYRAALELYAGDLLPEDRYEEWAEARREELRTLYLALLAGLARLYEERGEFALAIEALGKAASSESILEEAYNTSLMRLYALSGKRQRALRQYERLRENLLRELGTEPNVTTQRVYQEIAAGRFPSSHEPPASPPVKGFTIASRHNLPAPRTSFVGREQELVDVKRALSMTRLLTLTGVGGSGKTRLLLEVIRDLVGAYPDGVWLVELASLSDPALVPQAVITSLEIHEQPSRPLVETLVEALRGKEMLLALDNCEHLMEAVADLVNALLDACPYLRILATSRETLAVAGELVWQVPPLSVPELHLPLTVAELEGYESARLFLDRVSAKRPDFALTRTNAETVAAICRRLEGIPLAIELAAVRVGALSVEQILERLANSLKLLTDGGRTTAQRQKTLRLTLDWSYDLLSKSEKGLYGRLSAFRGGWTLEAAEAVGTGTGIEEGDVLDLLSALVDKSLVVAEGIRNRGVRYRMLEPVRQHAREKLEESREAGTIQRRHAEFFLTLAEAAEPELMGPEQGVWLACLETEHDNLRKALNWALEHEDELGPRLAGVLRRFWRARGHLTEGRRWLDRLAGSGTASVRAKVLEGAGWLAEAQGDYEQAEELYKESLTLSEHLGDRGAVASNLDNLGSLATFRGDDERATELVERSLTIYQEQEDGRGVARALNTLGALAASKEDLARAVALFEEALTSARKREDAQVIAVSLDNLGFATLLSGDWKRASALLEESLAIAREVGDTLDIAIVLINVSFAALMHGDYKRVTVLIEESLVLLRTAGDKQHVADCLEKMAAVAAAQEKTTRAARLWGAAVALREDLGAPLEPREREILQPYVAAARSRLGGRVWEVARAEGRKMTSEEAIEYALSEEETAPSTLPTVSQESSDVLTRREEEIAMLVARGLTNRQIASELSISQHTAATHVRKILKKLGLKSRAQIGSWLTEQHLSPLDTD